VVFGPGHGKLEQRVGRQPVAVAQQHAADGAVVGVALALAVSALEQGDELVVALGLLGFVVGRPVGRVVEVAGQFVEVVDLAGERDEPDDAAGLVRAAAGYPQDVGGVGRGHVALEPVGEPHGVPFDLVGGERPAELPPGVLFGCVAVDTAGQDDRGRLRLE
jgi:hypothetical protein